MDNSTLIATLAIIISVLTLVIQYYLQIRLTKAQRSFEMMSKLNENNLAEFSFPEIWDFYQKPYEDEGKKNHKFTLLIDMRFALFEEIHSQYRMYKLTSPREWGTWRSLIERNVTKPFFIGYWLTAEPYFNKFFVDEIHKICNENGINLQKTK